MRSQALPSLFAVSLILRGKAIKGNLKDGAKLETLAIGVRRVASKGPGFLEADCGRYVKKYSASVG